MSIWNPKTTRPAIGRLIVEHFRESDPSAYALYYTRGGFQTGSWCYLDDLLKIEKENSDLRAANYRYQDLIDRQAAEIKSLKK